MGVGIGGVGGGDELCSAVRTVQDSTSQNPPGSRSAASHHAKHWRMTHESPWCQAAGDLKAHQVRGLRALESVWSKHPDKQTDRELNPRSDPLGALTSQPIYYHSCFGQRAAQKPSAVHLCCIHQKHFLSPDRFPYPGHYQSKMKNNYDILYFFFLSSFFYNEVVAKSSV